jgi:predicted RNA-binding Zn-ribbon protein involved in translation (DUF1610 family)
MVVAKGPTIDPCHPMTGRDDWSLARARDVAKPVSQIRTHDSFLFNNNAQLLSLRPVCLPFPLNCKGDANSMQGSCAFPLVIRRLRSPFWCPRCGSSAIDVAEPKHQGHSSPSAPYRCASRLGILAQGRLEIWRQR